MNNMKLLYFSFIFMGAIAPLPAFTEDSVHFGTIFVEEIDYEQANENQGINHLTDSSKKQVELETLYKKEIGQENTKLKKVDYSPRTPATAENQNDKTTLKVGVARNDELPKKIIYFLELRSFADNASKPVLKDASLNSATILNIQPGEMLKFSDSPDQYIHKMRMDRDNQGLWKTVTTREQDIQNPHLYYDWRNFETITSHDFPIELDILVPYGKNSLPVFSRPGSWTWKDCGLSEDLCIDNIDLHTKAYLFDSTIIDVKLSENLKADYKIFYKIGYQLKDKDGVLQHRVGWIPSDQAKRKISQLPKSLLATRNPNSFGSYESDEERLQRLKKYYVFDSNMSSNNRTMNRWLASTPGNTTEVFFQNIAIDAVASYNNFHLEQSFIPDQAFDQTGISVGLGIFAPIFIDLEIQGTGAITVPIESTQTGVYEKAYLFRAEQWLLYTTPISVGSAPFKFGLGGYYQSMFSGNKEFGFNSLVGFQAKALFEHPSFSFGFRYGPTGQDFSLKFENREIGADISYRISPERKYESWTFFGDLADTSYVGQSGQSIKFQIMQLGIRKQF
jgi:hypothetical protein